MKDSKCPYEIVYEDAEVLVVYKKRDVLTLRTSDKKTWSHNLYHYLKLYLARKGEELFIVHRLDYETSGLLIFAKSGAMKAKLQAAFAAHEVTREYECVVKEPLEKGASFHVAQYLAEKGERVFPVGEGEGGKLALTDIVAASPIRIGTACRVRIATGRRNQIRLALASLGLTLLGDRRYAHSEAKRMYLNAYHLAFPSSLGLAQSDFYVPPLWVKEDRPPHDPSDYSLGQVGPEELPSVLEILGQAKKLLARNSLQWQNGYPNEATMAEDIEKHRLYGIYYGHELLGFEALVPGVNENYLAIENGSWILPPSPRDLVLHRIAVQENHHGEHLGERLLSFAIRLARSQGYASFKIDTHPANIPMQKLCEKAGLSYRGVIRILGEAVEPERKAYELALGPAEE